MERMFRNLCEHFEEARCNLHNAYEAARYNHRAHRHKQVREGEAKRAHDEGVVERETSDVERAADTLHIARGRVPANAGMTMHNSPVTP